MAAKGILKEIKSSRKGGGIGLISVHQQSEDISGIWLSAQTNLNDHVHVAPSVNTK